MSRRTQSQQAFCPFFFPSMFLCSEFFKDTVPWMPLQSSNFFFIKFVFLTQFLTAMPTALLLYIRVLVCKALCVSKQLGPGSVVLFYNEYRSQGVLPQRSHAHNDPCWLLPVVLVTNEHSFSVEVKSQRLLSLIQKYIFNHVIIFSFLSSFRKSTGISDG